MRNRLFWGRYDEGEVRLHLEKFRQIHREPPSKLCAMGMFETRRRQKSSFPVPTRTLNDFKPPSLDETPTRTDSGRNTFHIFAHVK